MSSKKLKKPSTNAAFCSVAFVQWLEEKIPSRISQCSGVDEANANSIWSDLRSSLLTEDGQLHSSINFGLDQDGFHYRWNCPKCSKKLSFKLTESGRPHVVNTLQHLLDHYKLDMRKKKRPASEATAMGADTSVSGSPAQRVRVDTGASTTSAGSNSNSSTTVMGAVTMV